MLHNAPLVSWYFMVHHDAIQTWTVTIALQDRSVTIIFVAVTMVSRAGEAFRHFTYISTCVLSADLLVWSWTSKTFST